MSDFELRALQRAAIADPGYRTPGQARYVTACERARVCQVCLGPMSEYYGEHGVISWRGMLATPCGACRAAHDASELALERQRVELVFGLTGGELADEPWVMDTGEPVARYWYESVPEWAAEDFDRSTRHSASGEYRTAVSDGDPGEVVGWERIRDYSNSGEAECWCVQTDEDDPAECPLCEGDGYVYLGDGWRETVYRRIPSTREDLAEALDEEHSEYRCHDNTCDITAAAEAGLVLWAAHLLVGSTECPDTERAYAGVTAAMRARGEDVDAALEAERVELVALMVADCRGCGGILYTSDEACGNCNGSDVVPREADRCACGAGLPRVSYQEEPYEFCADCGREMVACD